jgi:DNA repair exonuclease SbcCD ATPase subunit
MPRADGPVPIDAEAVPVSEVEAEEATALVRNATGAEPVPASALRDLARAFQANAEALRGIHEVQGDLARALQRGDRAEMMLHSTNALNDTFRNLASVQRQLLERLEKPPPGPGRLLPLMIIALLVVFVGGIVVVVHLVDRVREERADPLQIATEMDAARQRGHDAAAQASERELAKSAQELAEAESRLAALQEKHEQRQRELDETLSTKRALEAEQSALADEHVRLRGEAAARRVVEDELRNTTSKLAVLEPRLRQLEADLAAERAEKERLRTRIAERRLGIASDAEPDEKPSAAAPKDLPRATPVSRDAHQLEAIRTTVNRFLEVAGQGKPEYWQLTRAAGVSADRLHDVVAFRYDNRGKLLDSIEAEELVMWVDRTKRVVEFEFRRGKMVFDKVKTPFRDGTHSRIVAEGDEAVRLWIGSGLLILRNR